MSNQQPPYPLHPTVIDRINPEYKAFYNTHIINQQQVHLQPIQASRSSGILLPGGAIPVPVGRTTDYVIPRAESHGPAVAVRCFTPLQDNGIQGNIDTEAPAGGWPALVYFHGGGWVIGNIDTENAVCTSICARGKCVVISVDYRLAPENPFPAAIEDAWEAVLWVLGRGKELLHLDTSKLAVGGSSAGGNIAAVMCQRAIVRGSPRFCLQLHSVPVMDNTADVGNNTSWEKNQHAPALPAPKMLWYRNHYLPDRKDWHDPEASPLLWSGDWAKMPTAIIVLGELDILCGEGEQFAKILRDAGVKAGVHVLKGQPHPFLAMSGVLEDGERAVTWFCEGMLALSKS